ncbi:hypothetical protein [Cohnella abietis]|uniref:Uncharacterized protein n=1 Tax=Cohnella abietis TaxID=2507935 RepID=A0A3T1CZH4_9BACL|nr:hypothetical protein [Cohnella abietis]BBI31234.1 hypothetical protein KCTCHS21_06330 [Cohnella abietis]
MKKKSRLLITGSLVVTLVIGGGIAINNSGVSRAWAAEAVSTADSATKAPTDKPASEAGKVEGKGEKRNKGCEGDKGVGGPKKDHPAGSKGTKPSEESASNNPSEQAVNTVVISGGFKTDPEDHGRPVVLIAAALGVPTDVFREAFSGVTPAGSGEPSSELAQKNKAALLKVLEPYGITSERLDEVSNYYRYKASKGETWTKTAASATVTVTNGVMTGVKITNAGAGYSSNPTITIKGPDGKVVTATATVSYSKDFKTNGRISAITINK